MAFRNESPSSDLSDEDFQRELIGQTAYTKLYCIDLIKRIMNNLILYCSDGFDNEYLNEDLDFDDDLCKFMDITVEPDVLEFIKEFTFFELLCHAISLNKSDRLNEIFIGILANFSSNDSICLKMTNNLKIVNVLISFWSSDCPSFLLECSRLLKLVLKNSTCSPTWLQVMKCDNFVSHIIFIFNSSRSSELLISTMQVVSQLMKLDDELCEKWISLGMLSAALVARQEAEWFVNNDIDYFHYLIHLFSTCENGIVALISNFHAVYASFNEYLNKICDEEPHLIIISHYHNSLRLILPTIDVVVSNLAPNEALNLLQSHPTVLDNLVRLVYSCNLQADNATAQEVYLEISSFFNTVINITHLTITSTEKFDRKQIQWLQSVDVGACVQQLQSFVTCCTQNELTKAKLLEITQKLGLTYLYEALTELSIK